MSAGLLALFLFILLALGFADKNWLNTPDKIWLRSPGANIEIDDNSHNAPERMERDRFVDEVVQSVGYKIIHTRAITAEIKELITGKPEEEKLPDVNTVELKL